MSRGVLAVIAGVFAVAGPVRAQTADDYNRAAQAIRVCSSGGAAMIPECAQVRARFGLPSVSAQAAFGGAPVPAASVLPGLGGGKAGAVAGLLGMAMSAASKSQAVAPTPPPGAASAAPADMSLGSLNLSPPAPR